MDSGETKIECLQNSTSGNNNHQEIHISHHYESNKVNKLLKENERLKTTLVWAYEQLKIKDLIIKRFING